MTRSATGNQGTFEVAVEARVRALSDCAVRVLDTVEHGNRTYPIYLLEFGRGDRHVLLTGGVHGDERAGVHAALEFVEERAREWGDRFRFHVVPCVNPSGFEADTLESAEGVNLNRAFTEGSEVVEVRAVLDWLEAAQHRFRVAVDLHEIEPEYEGEGFKPEDNPNGTYLYETVSDGSSRLGHEMVLALPPGTRICDWEVIYGDVSDRGVVSYPEGNLNPYYRKGTTLDGFLNGTYTAHSFTLETPTSWPLTERVAVHLSYLDTLLRHLTE